MTRVLETSLLTLPHVASLRNVSGNQPAPGTLSATARFWLLFFSLLDVVITYVILTRFDHMGGREANYFALAIIERFGFSGAVLLKVWCLCIAVGACICIARTRPVTAVRLQWLLVAIACVPVAVGAGCLVKASLM